MTFGERIAYARKQKMIQADLGKAIGTSGEIIGKYERDEVNPSIEVAAKIAEVLGVTWITWSRMPPTRTSTTKPPND